MKGSLNGFEKFKDLGLVALRAVAGLTLVHYGWLKLMGGPSGWTAVGKAMEVIGITFGAQYWGLAATFSQLLGGLLIVIGAWTRIACALLFITMLVAMMTGLSGFRADDIQALIKVYYPLTMCAILFALFFTGAGKFSVDGSSGGGRSRGDKA
jgi:putative oxidoreductase